MFADRIVVADSSRARIFSMESLNKPLREIADFINPEGRAHERDLSSDQPGRSFDSQGAGRHAMETHVSIKKQEVINFSKRIAEYINQECAKGEFKKLILIAAPEFLGILRTDLSKNTRQHLVRQIVKNIVKQDEKSIRKVLF